MEIGTAIFIAGIIALMVASRGLRIVALIAGAVVVLVLKLASTANNSKGYVIRTIEKETRHGSGRRHLDRIRDPAQGNH
jgi:hypothetical protein